jgi:hypothetical protein
VTYDVWKKINEGQFTKDTVNPVNDPRYTVIALEKGQSYAFKVTAIAIIESQNN